MPDRSRRDLLRGGLTLVSAALVAGSDALRRTAPAPAPSPTRRVGVMLAVTRDDSTAVIGAFLTVLRERGWDFGSNLTVEWREAQDTHRRSCQTESPNFGCDSRSFIESRVGLLRDARAKSGVAFHPVTATASASAQLNHVSHHDVAGRALDLEP